MTERSESFDQEAVAKALGARPQEVVDPAFGQGHHFQVQGDNSFLSLDTFPDSGVSRITTKGARIELFGGTLPSVEEEGIVFLQKDADHEHSTVSLHPDGAITMGYQVDTGPLAVPGLPDTDASEQAGQEPATEASPAAKPPEKAADNLNRMPGAFPDVRPMIHQVGEPPQPSEPEHPLERAARVRPEDAPPKQQDGQTHEAAEAEPERVKLTGRIGRTPTTRETAGGKLVAKFPLALHNEDGTTTWRDVLAFNERAAALAKRVEAGELKKGSEIDVVGYPHERQYTGRDGTPKTAQEIYSVAITKR
ncbi:single-stranded DNA-binding protein [Kitasatospora sp. NPDC005856]|uniref:single-stranded DNA-binding protein n=1 Tax=Kitasatospora sp. NPDC005856 TaxID=3154566 RepID=UPI003407D111